MEGEPANDEKPSDEDGPLDRAEVGSYITNLLDFCIVRHDAEGNINLCLTNKT